MLNHYVWRSPKTVSIITHHFFYNFQIYRFLDVSTGVQKETSCCSNCLTDFYQIHHSKPTAILIKPFWLQSALGHFNFAHFIQTLKIEAALYSETLATHKVHQPETRWKIFTLSLTWQIFAVCSTVLPRLTPFTTVKSDEKLLEQMLLNTELCHHFFSRIVCFCSNTLIICTLLI
jgi:hypothetical protein